MNGTLMLYLDQYGNHFYARTVRELREKVGSSGSRIAKMYVENGADGEPRHVGHRGALAEDVCANRITRKSVILCLYNPVFLYIGNTGFSLRSQLYEIT